MSLGQAFSVVPAVVPASFERFTRHLEPGWVEEALTATGTATIRRRRLPAEQVLGLVIGMAMMRDESIERVALELNIALPAKKDAPVAKSALVQARQRLSDKPLEHLFKTTSNVWATRSAAAHRWRGLAIYAADGTTLRVPDTVENWDSFGGQVGSGKRGGSAYPTVRAVALIAARSHIIAALRFGAYKTGEVTLARELWADVPDDSLTILDRGFLVSTDLVALCSGGLNRQWLTRAKSTTRLRTIKKLGRNDALVEIELSDWVRKEHPELPERWVVRAIRYQRKGYATGTLLTSMLDAERFPSAEIVAMYHERWEIELAYDEIKTHMLDREEAIRSRTPEGVRQEIWAIGLAYNLVRLEMERVAADLGVPPTRISFVNALSMICNAWVVWSSSWLGAGRIPEKLDRLHYQLRFLLLPERRPERLFPRAVKLKMSNYLRKRPVGRPAK